MILKNPQEMTGDSECITECEPWPGFLENDLNLPLSVPVTGTMHEGKSEVAKI
ncbi:MAG: hypothetical protein KIS29_06575 [Thermoplasmata archaeon]|nr:hypothetical protein [Candidatus Sysuiplasma jiujiangense]